MWLEKISLLKTNSVLLDNTFPPCIPKTIGVEFVQIRQYLYFDGNRCNDMIILFQEQQKLNWRNCSNKEDVGIWRVSK